MKIVSVDSNDGTAQIIIDFDDDFKQFFLDQTGLKRFSSKRFQAWFVQGLHQGLTNTEK
tara:strand:+ start:282 stop:458 length:177 start_codon:yes stop_codon:yes gene_type:complete